MDRLRQWSRNPFVATVAIGVLLLGVMTLLSAVSSRKVAYVHPPGTAEPVTPGYQGLINANVVPTNAQYVAVLTVPLLAGDRVEPEMIERRVSTQVVAQFPTLRSERARSDPKAPPLDGYYEQVDDAVGKYALLDMPAGMPLGPKTVASESPLADPLDRQRPDRFTVPMAAEPTLYQLLRPGDRVDIFLVVPGQLSRRTLHNVRVVAVNNYLSADSGLLDRNSERERFGTRQEAAQRKRQRILAEQARLNRQAQPGADSTKGEPAKPGDQAPADGADQAAKAGASAEAKAEPAKAEPAKAEPPAAEAADGESKGQPTKPGALQNLDAEGGNVTRAGKAFDGRAVTLQVSPAEALLLATAMCTPKVEIEFSLRPRPH